MKMTDYGTYTKTDYDRVVDYSVNNELDLIEDMINDGSLVEIPKGTKVTILDLETFGASHVRIINTNTQLWIPTSSLKSECD